MRIFACHLTVSACSSGAVVNTHLSNFLHNCIEARMKWLWVFGNDSSGLTV